MATRWSQTPNGVKAIDTGPSRAASIAAALLTLVGATLAMLIVGALMLPGSATPADGGTAAGASPSATAPSTGVGSLASPRPTVAPVIPNASSRPSSAPATATPTPTPAPSVAPVEVALRTAAPVSAGGRELGRVTIQAIRQVKDTNAVPAGKRLMIAVVRLDADLARLPYDELHFRLVDENGDRYEPVVDAAPQPLGAGTLAPSTKVSGQVAFALPGGRKAVKVVLTDGAGDDLVVFTRPQPAS